MNNNTSQMSYSKAGLLPFLICGVGAFFYVYEFFLRVMPSAMTDELMRSFQIDAGGLGVLSAFFYYGYTPMQIPAGLLLDRYGPRILLSLSMMVCAVGALAFGLTNSAIVASMARLFIGLVSAFAFVGALVLATRWFAARYFALIVGLIQLMGCIGAIVGEAPVAIMVQHIGWRSTMFWSAGVGAIFAILFWVIIRDRPEGDRDSTAHTEHQPNELQRLSQVVKNPQTWTVGLYAFACWAPIAIFADLWGIPYLKLFYNTSVATAATAIAVVWIGIAVAGPVVGWWSNKIANRRTPLLLCSILGLISSLFILYVPGLPWPFMYLALFVFGAAASSQAVSFGLVQDNNHISVAGTAVGFNNMAVILGGLLFQPLVGFILNNLWDGTIINGLHFYSLENYRSALILLPICSVIGIFASIFLVKETHCQPQFSEPTSNLAYDLQK
ncbi:MAG: MFS transporter [Gammaproteobacteria bacterium]|nr:MFS transporter [Gammaproteobacteria bacterium]